jgi:hypothetical protein
VAVVDLEIAPGREFFHAWYREQRRPDLPARCVVTGIREGRVYYRAYIGKGEKGRPTDWREVRRFGDILKEWADG